MCQILDKYEGKAVTGYKIAIKDNGKYYSPATGIEYKVGSVTPAKANTYSLHCTFFEHVTCKSNFFYNRNMHGKTMVFQFIGDCRWLFREVRYETEIGEVVLLEMRLSGDLHYAGYAGDDCFVGSHIDHMEEIVCGVKK